MLPHRGINGAKQPPRGGRFLFAQRLLEKMNELLFRLRKPSLSRVLEGEVEEIFVQNPIPLISLCF